MTDQLQPERLQPMPWCLDQPPPLAPPAPSHPLVLLLESQQPLEPACRASLQASLAPAERQRLAGLRRPADQHRFLLARGGLRRLLAACVGGPAAAVPLEAGRHGKPHCPGGPAFNLSHAGDLILIALHPQQPVGVDVERQRPGLSWPPIARRVLPAAEWQALEQLPAAAQPAACLAAWCRLEARLKANGEGFAGLERLRRDPSACSATALWDVVVPEGYAAAVALAPSP
ncbi:MAG: 4'-phosphopantetheinyl transferase superfamily protein [Cyanobacteriota bacterium]|nr:4'-phosphopantetheinyl transferase superfamily protein [Cyanobacteriota bacterium]